MLFTIRFRVTLKLDIPDPAGREMVRKIAGMNMSDITEVRVGKYFEIDLDVESEAVARERVDAMCKGLLANQYIEEHTIVSVLPG